MRTSSQFRFGVRPAAETPGPLSWRQAAMGAGAAYLSAVLLFAVVFFQWPLLAAIPAAYLLAFAPVGGVIGYLLARVFGSRGPLALRWGVFAVAGGRSSAGSALTFIEFSLVTVPIGAIAAVVGYLCAVRTGR